ncbi:MAG: hypothetical protein ABI854_04640 [Betaproteobacteria bacterium]
MNRGLTTMRGFRSMWIAAATVTVMALLTVTRVAAATPEQSATELAHAWARAIMTSDVEAQMKLLPTTMYAKPGERERNRLLRLHEKEMAVINKQKLVTFDVRAPIQTLKINNTTVVVIPYQSVVTIADGTLQTDSVLVALTDESSDKWGIFDGTGHGTRSLKQLIPGYTIGLTIPPARVKVIKGE